MLPSLTAAFLFGLLCGSELPFFPLSLIGLLVGVAVGFSALERAGYLDTQSALLLYVSVLSGVVYWTVTAPPPQDRASLPALHDTAQATFTVRVVAPVQHSLRRQTLLVQTEDSASKSSTYALCGVIRVSRFTMATVSDFTDAFTVRTGR